jgi:radical SAM superfamily enzyme YgiQ (UPF0313 family)
LTDVVLLTPREIATGTPSINNQNILVTDSEYLSLDPALRVFYEKVRENLGLACITGHLRHAGYSVNMVNLHGRNPGDDAVRELIRQEQPTLIGVSIMYDLHILDAIRLVRCAREAAPEAFIVLGGAFCTYNAATIALQVPDADCVAFGEAERTVVALMERLTSGRDWRDVPGLHYRTGEGRVRSSGAPLLADLASGIWPARDVLRTHQAAGIPTPAASAFTSRGCHAKCTFCYAPRQPGTAGDPWRLRPAADVVDEIECLQREFGTRFIWLNDDNFGGSFTDGFAHAVEFAEEVVRRGLKFAFHAEFRVDSGLIDHDALELLRRAGLKSALLGLESGSPAMLKRFRKGTTVAYNFNAARIFRRKQIELDPGWIMVEPQTSLAELWENLEFIVASDVHQSNHADNPFLLLNRAIALRGTEMYDRIDSPLAPDGAHGDGPAAAVLRDARRDYLLPDAQVETLWTVWSTLGGELSERRENRLPFLAQSLATSARRLRGTDADPRPLIGRLRAWRNDLPQLFAAVLNYGLLLVDAWVDCAAEDLRARLDADLREMAAEYDRTHLGMSFELFESEVARLRRAVGELVEERAGG